MATLSNFVITSPTNQDILIYSNGNWINSQISGFFGILDGRYSINTHNHDGTYLKIGDSYTKAETYPASSLYTRAQVYTKTEVDDLLAGVSGGGGGLVDGASNIGTGANVFSALSNGILEFRRLNTADSSLLDVAVSGNSVIFTPITPSWTRLVSDNGQITTAEVNFANQSLNTNSSPTFGNLTVDGGTNTTLNIISNDGGESELNLLGSSQGTGRIYVGQSTQYGGGIEYNGDGTPASSGITDDVSFFRRNAGSDSLVMHYRYDSSVVNFVTTPTVSGNQVYHEGHKPTYSELGTISPSDTNFANQYLNTGSNVTFANATVSTNLNASQVIGAKVALMTNDGYGNANLTFNHAYGTPSISGNAARIEVNTDATTNASFSFELDSNVVANDPVNLTQVLYLSETEFHWKGNKIFHAGNDGPGSGLNADLLDNYQLSGSADANTVALRNGSADIHARLFRSNYGTQTSLSATADLCFRNDNGSDNYMRFATRTAIADWLDGESKFYSSNNQPQVLANLGTYTVPSNRNVLATGIHSYGTTTASHNPPHSSNYGESIVWGQGTAGSIEIWGGWTSGGWGRLYTRALRNTTDSWSSWYEIYTSRAGVPWNNVTSKPDIVINGQDASLGRTVISSTGTIAGADFNSGWLQVGTSTNGWAIDPNEIYCSGNGIIGTLSGKLTFQPASGEVDMPQTVRLGGNLLMTEANSGNILRLTNGNGYVEYGANNTGYAHLYTDRPQFYTNKPIRVSSELSIYNNHSRLADTYLAVGQSSSYYAELTHAGDLTRRNSGWANNPNEVTFLRQGWQSVIGDYIQIHAVGNATSNGALIVGRDVFAVGKSDYASPAAANDGAVLNTDTWMSINSERLYFQGKSAIRFYDSWLRINDSGGFGNGIYFGSSRVRTDGHIEVGNNGQYFYASGTKTEIGTHLEVDDIRATSGNYMSIAAGELANVFYGEIPNRYNTTNESVHIGGEHGVRIYYSPDNMDSGAAGILEAAHIGHPNTGTSTFINPQSNEHPALTVQKSADVANAGAALLVACDGEGTDILVEGRSNSVAPNTDVTGRFSNNTSGDMQFQIWANGNAYFKGTVDSADTKARSDIRVKEDLELISNAKDKVRTLTGWTFMQTEINQRMASIIAQDLQKILPEAVGESGDGMLTVSPMGCIGLLVNAFNEEAEENEVLRDKVSSLEERLAKLEEIIDGNL